MKKVFFSKIAATIAVILVLFTLVSCEHPDTPAPATDANQQSVSANGNTKPSSGGTIAPPVLPPDPEVPETSQLPEPVYSTILDSEEYLDLSSAYSLGVNPVFDNTNYIEITDFWSLRAFLRDLDQNNRALTPIVSDQNNPETCAKLTADITIPETYKLTVDTGRTKILDLNGYTISSYIDNRNENYIEVINDSSLTIQDNSAAKTGCFTTSYNAQGAIKVLEGTLILQGGTIISTGKQIYGSNSTACAIYVDRDGILTLEGGTLKGIYGLINDGNVTDISNTTIIAERVAINNLWKIDTITNGIFTAESADKYTRTYALRNNETSYISWYVSGDPQTKEWTDIGEINEIIGGLFTATSSYSADGLGNDAVIHSIGDGAVFASLGTGANEIKLDNLEINEGHFYSDFIPAED